MDKWPQSFNIDLSSFVSYRFPYLMLFRIYGKSPVFLLLFLPYK